MPLHARDGQGPDDVDHERCEPHPGPVVRVDEPSRERNESGNDEPRRQTRHRAEHLGIASNTPGVERGVEDAHDEVRHREPRGLVLERVRDGQGHEEPGGHGREHDQPRHGVLDVDCVRHPRVRGPGPPHHREHERGPGEALEARVLEDQRRDLREREDEDEVEEELEIARLALFLGRRLLVDERRDVAHAAATARSRYSTDSGRARRLFDEAIPANRLAGSEEPLREQSAGVRAVHDPARLGLERSGELERHDRPVQIGVVVDRGDGDVDLRGPVGGAASVRRHDSLVAGDELPPERVEIAVRVRVQPALERVHHEHPAGEDEKLDRSCGTHSRLELGALARAQAENVLEPVAPPRQRAEQDRRRLGRDEVRRAEEPRQLVAQAEVVDAVAELVQHRVCGLVGRHEVREHADVAPTVDVDAERVLVLAVAGVDVAPRDDAVRLEADALDRPAGKGDDVRSLEVRIEIDCAVRRCLLEERVGVVPWPEVGHRAPEARRQPLVEDRLPALERLGGRPVGLGERVRQPPLVELVGREGQRVPVPMAQRPRRLVAQARDLAHVVGHDGADGLRRLPRLSALPRVVTPAEDLLDLGVPHLAAADDAAMAREAQVDRRLELDDPLSQPVRHLMSQSRVVEEVEAPADVAARTLVARGLDRGELLAVGERVRPCELRAFPLRRVVLGRLHLRIPPRDVRVLEQRGEPCFRLLDDVAAGGAHRFAILPASREQTDEHDLCCKSRTFPSPGTMRRSLGPLLCELHGHASGATSRRRPVLVRQVYRAGLDDELVRSAAA